jgi:L-amino acid N-acyltransferase YncA
MRIRLASPDDWPHIIAIYNQAVAEPFCTADTEPATLASRGDWLAQHRDGRYPIFVVESDHAIAGWCSLSPWRAGRKALEQTAEISYYIDRDHRGQRLGSRLLQHALSACPQLGFTHLLAILLERNIGSLALLEKFAFVRWGHLPEVAAFDRGVCGQYIYGRKV